MALALAESTTNNQSTAVSVAASTNAAAAIGDLILAIHSGYNFDNVAHTLSNDAAFNFIVGDQITNRCRLRASNKYLAVAEDGPWSFDSSQTVDHQCPLLRLTGALASAPINASGSVNGLTVASITCPSVNTNVDNCMIFYACHWNGSGTVSGTPADSTLVYDTSFTGEATHRLQIYRKTMVGQGASGTGVFARSAAANMVGLTIAVAPATGNRRRREIILGMA